MGATNHAYIHAWSYVTWPNLVQRASRVRLVAEEENRLGVIGRPLVRSLEVHEVRITVIQVKSGYIKIARADTEEPHRPKS